MITRTLITASILLALSACGKATDDAAATGQASAGNADTTAVAQAVALSGKAIFNRCAACHKIEAGAANGIGPNLHGIVGRSVASVPGFTYSTALKNKGGVWDKAALDEYLAHPAKSVPGTKMAFVGIAKADERNTLIDYLAAQK